MDQGSKADVVMQQLRRRDILVSKEMPVRKAA
jgi:hypothetical protein